MKRIKNANEFNWKSFPRWFQFHTKCEQKRRNGYLGMP
jgi:hypothetical protein